MRWSGTAVLMLLVLLMQRASLRLLVLKCDSTDATEPGHSRWESTGKNNIPLIRCIWATVPRKASGVVIKHQNKA